MYSSHEHERFGRLVIVGFNKGTKHRKRKYVCQCDCGGSVLVAYNDLLTKNTNSCGCLNKELASIRATTHGHSKHGRVTKEYIAYRSMKARCYKPSQDMYHNYGGRGISVCERWLESFENFISDMGKCPTDFTLERIDVNGNYEPSNCKWASMQEQVSNKRNNVYGEWEGKTYHLAELVRITGRSRPFLRGRISLGIPLDAPDAKPWDIGGKRYHERKKTAS